MFSFGFNRNVTVQAGRLSLVIELIHLFSAQRFSMYWDRFEMHTYDHSAERASFFGSVIEFFGRARLL